MKAKIKQILRRIGAYYPILHIWNLPKVVYWIRHGCPSPAPHVIKMQIVKAYMKQSGLIQFVETGTYLGETLEYIARSGATCTSVELSKDLYDLAQQRFRKYSNVTLVYGDSGREIPKILATLGEPTLFWLDGHYSADSTAKGEADTPVNAELDAILNHRIKTHIILIDDARHFNGTGDYPRLEELIHTVRQTGEYEVEVSTDIIRLTPNHPRLKQSRV